MNTDVILTGSNVSFEVGLWKAQALDPLTYRGRLLRCRRRFVGHVPRGWLA
jgi:hypothetical protein